MAGIYIHIPFCKKACHYCDFHFSTNLSNKADMITTICSEIETRSRYINEEIETIYFGGGTPSLLEEMELQRVLTTIREHFQLTQSVEITLEANPEDLNIDRLYYFKKCGINRLSIGVQTFSNRLLNWMNRNHSGDQSTESFQNAREVGFDNISLDLIYALPKKDEDWSWRSDLERASDLSPDHISIYGLTIEENTVFGNWKRKEKLVEVPDDEAAEQYLFTIDFLKSHGLDQYEVSNFAKSNYQSKHNGAYWSNTPYLGVGPGAHSYNGYSRQFNVRHNAKYIDLVMNEGIYFEVEELSKIQLQNEQILTELRTKRGLDLTSFKERFGVDLLTSRKKILDEFASKKLTTFKDQKISLTSHGFLVADEIALSLFFDE